MVRLSTHFKLSEFACHCGCHGHHNADIIIELRQLCVSLEEVRTFLGDNPITIVSGFRCKHWNDNVGGAKKSQHLVGKAADIRVKGTTADVVHSEMLQHAPSMGIKGIGKYPQFVHLDVRSGPPARW